MKDYDKFLKEIDKIEEIECPLCKDKGTLTSVSFEEPLFMCSSCGKLMSYNIEENKWYFEEKK